MNMLQLFRKIISNESIDDKELMEIFKTEKNIKQVRSLIAEAQNPDIDGYYKLNVENELNKQNIPSKDFNFEAFKVLDKLMKIDALESGIEVSYANAIKLTTLFGDLKNALSYLEKFANKNPHLPHIGYQACDFPLPRSINWDIRFWRHLAVKYMPNDQLVKVLPHADKLENYLVKNKKEIEEEIRSEVLREYEIMLTNKFDELVKSGLFDLEKRKEYIEKRMKASEKKLEKDADKELDAIIRKKLNFSKSQKLGTDEIKLIKEEKLKPEYIVQRSAIRKALEEKLRDRLSREFQDSAKPVEATDIKEYIAKRMESEKHFIENKCASEISKIYTADGKISQDIDPLILFKYARKVAYPNAAENAEAAALFYEYGISEEGFNRYLELKPKDDPENIPDVFIEGNEIGHPGYYLKKLDPGDPIAAILGKMTSCCQYMGGLGEACAKHGISSEEGGFYVLCKKKYQKPSKDDIIVAQSWAWKGTTGRIMLDSIESQIDFKRRNEPVISEFYTYLGHKLVTEHGVKEVLVGANKHAGTPDSIKIFPSTHLENPIHYLGHRDSKTNQVVIANVNLPLAKIYASKRQKDNPLLLERMGIESKMLSEEAYLALINLSSDTHKVKKLIDEDKIDSNIAYVYSLKESNITLANYILEKGKFNYHEKNGNGDTPLAAAIKDNVDRLELLAKNTDFNAKNANDEIAFTIALKSGHITALRFLMQYHNEEAQKYLKDPKNQDLIFRTLMQNPNFIKSLKLDNVFSNTEAFLIFLKKNPSFAVKNLRNIKDYIEDSTIFDGLIKTILDICKSENILLPVSFVLDNQNKILTEYKEIIDIKLLHEQFSDLKAYDIYVHICNATKPGTNNELTLDLFKTFISKEGRKQRDIIEKLIELEKVEVIKLLIDQGLMRNEYVEILSDLLMSRDLSPLLDKLYAIKKYSEFLIKNGFIMDNVEIMLLFDRDITNARKYLENSWEFYEPEDAYALIEEAISTSAKGSNDEFLKYLLTHPHNSEGFIRQIPENEFKVMFNAILKLVPEYILENMEIIKDHCKNNSEFLKQFMESVEKIKPKPKEEAEVENQRDLTLGFDLKKKQAKINKATIIPETANTPTNKPNMPS